MRTPTWFANRFNTAGVSPKKAFFFIFFLKKSKIVKVYIMCLMCANTYFFENIKTLEYELSKKYICYVLLCCTYQFIDYSKISHFSTFSIFRKKFDFFFFKKLGFFDNKNSSYDRNASFHRTTIVDLPKERFWLVFQNYIKITVVANAY